MIVDDEPGVLEQLTEYIHQAGLGFHVVAKAQGAEDACYYLKLIKPDLVITDIRMPVTDGLIMLRQLRDAGWNGRAAVISGYDDFAYAQQAIRLGVSDYLLKPIFPENVRALLLRIYEFFQQEKTTKAQLRMEIEAEITSAPAEKDDHTLPSYLVQAKNYIKEHYADTLTLSYLAKIVCVNPAYLSSRFAKHCGQNFLEYLTDFRINKAKDLLKHTNLQIQEIADQIGYNDVTYFNRIFRRETGLTPGLYRSDSRK